MNPRIPHILGDVLEAASRTLDRPSGDLRRIDQIERLVEQVSEAVDLPTDQPRRLVNDWTLMLVKMLRKIERLGPLGDPEEISRCTTVGLAVLPYVTCDAGVALTIASHRPTTDQEFSERRGRL